VLPWPKAPSISGSQSVAPPKKCSLWAATDPPSKLAVQLPMLFHALISSARPRTISGYSPVARATHYPSTSAVRNPSEHTLEASKPRNRIGNRPLCGYRAFYSNPRVAELSKVRGPSACAFRPPLRQPLPKWIYPNLVRLGYPISQSSAGRQQECLALCGHAVFGLFLDCPIHAAQCDTDHSGPRSLSPREWFERWACPGYLPPTGSSSAFTESKRSRPD